MANEFLSIKNIARQALPRLIENLVFPNLIYKDYSSDYVQGQGQTIQVRKPVVLTASKFDQENGTSAQDIKENSVPVTLDQLATVDAEFGAISRATDVDDLNRLFVNPAATALAEQINSDGLSLYKDIAQFTGTAGTTPTELDTFSQAAKVLDDAKVPATMRHGIWDPAAMAKFRIIPSIANAEKSGTTEALRAGSIGNIFGIDNYMAQGVKAHTTGISTATAIKVNGAVASGATKLNIDGTALTGSLVAGDLIVIGGNSYTVTSDTAAAASNAIANVNVYPVLPAITDNTDATLISSHTANLVFHENAFAFVTRPLVAPAGVESYTTSFNGVTLRVVRGYDMKYKKEMISMDVLYGYKTMYPEMATRVLG